MIQRLQTLYLMAVMALSVNALFFPLASLQIDVRDVTESYPYFLYPKSETNIFIPDYVLLVLHSIVFLLSLITIFLYKNRILQMRVCAFVLLVCVIFVGYMFVWGVNIAASKNILQGTLKGYGYGIATYFPFAQMFFAYLAQKRIKKDEILIRSSERLR
jgi:hypothetical protein